MRCVLVLPLLGGAIREMTTKWLQKGWRLEVKRREHAMAATVARTGLRKQGPVAKCDASQQRSKTRKRKAKENIAQALYAMRIGITGRGLST